MAGGAVRRSDARDTLVQTLADNEAELLEQVVELTIARDSYQLLAQAAVHLLHARHVELSHLREQHHRLQDEYRELRAATMRRDAAEAAA